MNEVREEGNESFAERTCLRLAANASESFDSLYVANAFDIAGLLLAMSLGQNRVREG